MSINYTVASPITAYTRISFLGVPEISKWAKVTRSVSSTSTASAGRKSDAPIRKTVR